MASQARSESPKRRIHGRSTVYLPYMNGCLWMIHISKYIYLTWILWVMDRLNDVEGSRFLKNNLGDVTDSLLPNRAEKTISNSYHTPLSLLYHTNDAHLGGSSLFTRTRIHSMYHYTVTSKTKHYIHNINISTFKITKNNKLFLAPRKWKMSNGEKDNFPSI